MATSTPASASNYLPATDGKHLRFLTWSHIQGITFTKVRPARFPNAGLGIASTDSIEGPRRAKKGESKNQLWFSEGETIAFTPKAALLTRENLGTFSPALRDVNALLKELSTHACFAVAISNEMGNEKNKWKPWMKVWPGLEEFREGIPLLWKGTEQKLLPPSAISILETQKKNFEGDFEKVKKLGFEFTRDEYIYAWLVVNTRSLYYKPDTPDYKELAHENCMALCPFIDYFNHSDDGCKVELSPAGYTVTPLTTTIPAHTQLFVTYGCHSNDFLLCEYGFILPTTNNKWDEVILDPYVLPCLTSSQRAFLDSEGFLGNYIFDRSTFCFRTQAAVRMMLIKDPDHPRNKARVDQWRRFLVGQEDGERERAAVEEWLYGVLEKLKTRGREAWREAEGLEEGSVKRLVRERWEQILGMMECVEGNMKGNGEEGGGGRDFGAYIM